MANLISICDIGGSGYRVAIKDNISISGMPNTLGSSVFEDSESELINAEVVDNLLVNGCRIIGKSNMHELAYGMTGVNRRYGTPINSFYPKFMVGGSSSGSAALVSMSGDIDFAVGTDTGGSIRLPAACCGVWGFKPTYGRVSRRGVMPFESSLDCVGPLASSIQLIEKSMTLLDPTFQISECSNQIKIGYLNVDAECMIIERCKEVLSCCGFEVEFLNIPRDLINLAFRAGVILMNVEMAHEFKNLVDDNRLGDDVRERLKNAQNTSDTEVKNALRVKRNFIDFIDQLLEKTPILAMPTLPRLPLSREDVLAGKNDLSLSSLVRPFNLSGHPALAMPLSGDEPMSLQLVAAKQQDELVCSIAKEIVANCADQFIQSVSKGCEK